MIANIEQATQRMYQEAQRLRDSQLPARKRLDRMEKKLRALEHPYLVNRACKGPRAVFKRTALEIYEYCKANNIWKVRIVSFGNGRGKDLFHKKFYLSALGIVPEYYLVDYDNEASAISQQLNPDIPQSQYIASDLLKPFINADPFYPLIGTIHAIDCQQVLHELCSALLGGNFDALNSFLSQAKRLFGPQGRFVGEDVNIVTSSDRGTITFKVREKHGEIFDKTIDLLRCGTSVVQDPHEANLYTTDSQTWFERVLYMSLLVENDLSYNPRDFEEVHRFLTIEDWKTLFRNQGATSFKHRLYPAPSIWATKLREYYTLENGQPFPPFSIFFSADFQSPS